MPQDDPPRFLLACKIFLQLTLGKLVPFKRRKGGLSRVLGGHSRGVLVVFSGMGLAQSSYYVLS